VATGTLRLVVALGGSWLALHATGSLSAFLCRCCRGDIDLLQAPLMGAQ